jgi:radical SAM superfamily enzyme YgiQ (UPF0313 family)
MNIYRVDILDGVLPGWHSMHHRTKKEALKEAREEVRNWKTLTGIDSGCRISVRAIKVGTGKDAIIDALNDVAWGSLAGTEIFHWGGADDVLEG